jgi:hypothetical protein
MAEDIGNLQGEERIYRPLGVTIALLGAVVFFGIFPLIELYLAYRLDRASEGSFIIVGSDLIPLDAWTWFGGLAGLLVILVAIPAWLGRLRYIRFVFIGTILLSVAASIAKIIEHSESDNPILPQNAFESALQDVFGLQYFIQAVMLVYILWYLNRAPARAFYRQKPIEPWWQNDEDVTDRGQESQPVQKTNS